MGGFEPISAALLLGKQALDYHQQSQAARQAEAAQQAEYAARAAQLRQAQDIDKRRRDEALKAALATRRAGFGAAGVGSAGGSARALLQGLADEAAGEDQLDAALTGQRLDALGRSAEASRRQNLLEMAELRRRNLFSVLKEGSR